MKVAQQFWRAKKDEQFENMDVYMAVTVDQGDNIVKSFRCFSVPVLVCATHLLNSMVTWDLGLSGSEEKFQNPGLCDLINRASNLVSAFNHSSVASDALKDFQREMGP